MGERGIERKRYIGKDRDRARDIYIYRERGREREKGRQSERERGGEREGER